MTHITRFDEQEFFQPFPGLRAKLVHTTTQTYAFWQIEKGAILPAHHHMHEQISIVTKGQLELTIKNETSVVTSGMLANIPPNAVHSARALTDVEVTDVFTPVREDFPNTPITPITPTGPNSTS